MELSETTISCRQCGTNLIHDVSVPSSPTPQLLHGHRVPSNHAEVVGIKSYISKVENILSILDADLAVLNDAMERLGRMREEAQTALIDHRTLIAPIRRLPNEILTEIFWLCCPPIDFGHGPLEYGYKDLEKPTPFYLAQICSNWRRVMLSTPKLWSQINVSSAGPWNQSLMKAWIHRSGNTPLDILIDDDGELPQGDSKLGSICQLLVAESRRWRTVSITLTRRIILAYLQAIKGRLPLLESLYFFPYGSLEPPIHFFANAPNLRRLTISDFNCVADLSNTFHDLTYLKIHTGCDTTVTMWLDVLQACPNLIEFDLNEDWDGERAVLLHPMPMIYLGHLERFNMLVLGEPEVLFDHLETPNIRQISVTYYTSDSWLTQPSFISFLRRSSHSLTSLSIISASCEEEDEVFPDIIECLWAVPGLTSLYLNSTLQWIKDETMESLTIRANRPPLLPMLEELVFDEHTIDPDSFADMVESRCNLLDTDSCRRLKQVRVGLMEIPTFQPGSRQAWVERFEKYRKQGLRISVTGWTERIQETIL